MPDSLPTPIQPKISHKLAVRTLVLILILGAVYFGYETFKDKSQDITDLKPANTIGWLAAVQFQPDGQQAVAFSPEGKMTSSSNWKSGNTDRNITWNPSGNRIFFVSDREENNFHVFRWNPTDGSDPVRRTIGTRSRSEPQFPREAVENGDRSALITSGGFVLEYAPKDMSTRQVLPPQEKEIAQSSEEEGGGSSDQFSGAYAKFGNSFKVARWCKGKTWIAAIMRRDQGEILVLQNMQAKPDGRLPRPMPVAAGDKIEFDVSPKDGSIVFAVQNFQWPDENTIPPQFHKGNTITRPFNHIVGHVDPGSSVMEGPIAASKNDDIAFGSPSISPDGASVLLVIGKYENSAGLAPKVLATAPVQENGIASATKLTEGEVFEPTWSADGELIAFAEHVKTGKRALVQMHKDGSGRLELTGQTGDFGNPVFSPQAKSTP
jgi:hypothetical protein